LLEKNQDKINWTNFCNCKILPSYKYYLENIANDCVYVLK
jgi:hypothetical protein